MASSNQLIRLNGYEVAAARFLSPLYFTYNQSMKQYPGFGGRPAPWKKAQTGIQIISSLQLLDAT